MTYSQLRAALSRVALFGEDGAPTGLLPATRWMNLRTAGVVALTGGLWTITARGWGVLNEPTMATERPEGRPVQRKSARENRNHRQQRSA